jgi:hypothetical protein
MIVHRDEFLQRTSEMKMLGNPEPRRVDILFRLKPSWLNDAKTKPEAHVLQA